jgi:hypothetical protein
MSTAQTVYTVLYTTDRVNKKRKRKADGTLTVQPNGLASLLDADGREISCGKLATIPQVLARI